MNLKQMQYQAERNYDVTARLYKRISTLESQCAQLEIDVVMLHTIITKINEALAEQKEKPPGSGNNSPVFYNTTMDLVKSVKSNKSYYQGGPRDVY